MSLYTDFLDRYDYDVRKTRDARWIDQKCTYDVVSMIADCILDYIENVKEEFSVSDIWYSKYAKENVIAIFSKPDPNDKAKNEYDKFFGQPIKLLSYSKVLSVSRKKGNTNYYVVNNQEILESIALRPMNALNFLYEYITKVLKDSDLYNEFENFFDKQIVNDLEKQKGKDNYKEIREAFIKFTIDNTNINEKTECGRIFTKVINPLAFKMKKLGSIKGRISKKIITLSDIQYNRYNWRDEVSGKDKSITRNDYLLEKNDTQLVAFKKYTVTKAKRAVKRYNDKYYNSKGEIIQDTELVNATQAHHIFPQSEFSLIADYIENLIMLTPNQHYSMAHPNNNTQYVDKDFQYICLLAKLNRIRENLLSDKISKFYNFSDYKFVLNTGLKTDEFTEIKELDFGSIIEKIDYFYSDFISDNKYRDLISTNKFI